MWQTHLEAMFSNKKVAFNNIQYLAEHFIYVYFIQNSSRFQRLVSHPHPDNSPRIQISKIPSNFRARSIQPFYFRKKDLRLRKVEWLFQSHKIIGNIAKTRASFSEYSSQWFLPSILPPFCIGCSLKEESFKLKSIFPFGTAHCIKPLLFLWIDFALQGTRGNIWWHFDYHNLWGGVY